MDQPEITQPEKTPFELLNDRINEKVQELEKREGVKVYPILFFDITDKELIDPVIGYIKEPSRLAKIRILDKSVQMGDFAASSEFIDMCLIKNDSDPRIYSTSQAFDSYYLGACNEAQKIISISVSQYKKK